MTFMSPKTSLTSFQVHNTTERYKKKFLVLKSLAGSCLLHSVIIDARGVGKAQLNLATPDGNTQEMLLLTAYVLPCNLKTKAI